MNAAEMYEKKIKKFLDDVDRREKSINDCLDYKWSRLNKDDDLGVTEHFVGEIHDYKVILNELKNVRRELKGILLDVEDEIKASTPDGWYKG